MLEVHRPLGSAAHDRIAAAILAGGEATERRSGVSGGATTAQTRERTRGLVRRLYYIVPTLAAAAAIALFLSFRSPATLPDYDVSVRAASETRSAPEPVAANAPVRLHRSSTLDVVLRPREPLSGPVGIRAVLVRDGKTTPWAPEPELAAGGAVRIRGRVDAIIPDANGACEIVIAIARQDALPSDDDLARRATRGDTSDADHRVRYARVMIEIAP
jgi:hypothetical protein